MDMSAVVAEFLFKVALMIAGYFFVCSAISYGINYYFKTKDDHGNADSKDVSGGE